MPPLNNLIGKTFGRLTVIERIHKNEPKKRGWWLCQCSCGNQKVIAGNNLVCGVTKSCSCIQKEWASRRGPLSHHWKHGLAKTSEGYIAEYSPDHPRADMNGRVLQHRLVMEKSIGRYLFPNENVHHKNGIRSDNRIENLELWVKTQPQGQRVSDILLWAKEILEIYGN
jgi:hypothetical protein